MWTAASPKNELVDRTFGHAPVVVPLAAGALLLLYDERRRKLKAAIGLASLAVQLGAAVALLARATTIPAQVYALGDRPAPFGIVLVADRLSAMIAARGRAWNRCARLFARALASRRSALPLAGPVPPDGTERRVPDRRPLQPIRILRADAGRLLCTRASRLGHRARAREPALHRDQPDGSLSS